MKLKYFSVFIFLFILICSANAIYAASDSSILEMDQNQDIVSLGDEKLSDSLSNSQDEIISNQNDNAPLSDSVTGATGADVGPTTTVANTAASTSSNTLSSSSSVSPLKQFKDDLESGKSTVYLNGDIQISSTFDIRHSVTIDGQGHTIDAQKKCNIFYVGGCTVTFKNLKLINGKSTDGGAISGYLATVNIDGCTFKNNKASNYGGAVYVSSGKVNIKGSTFTGNSAKEGGAVYTYLCNLVIGNSHFKSNFVKTGHKMGHGGAVYVYKKSSSITKSTFTNNYCLSAKLKSHSKATKYQFGGGAVYYNEGGTHTISGCTFTGNKATNHGGAVYAHKPKTVKITQSTFKNNKVVYEDGGAVTFNGKKLLLKNCNFYNNHAYEDGGVMDACSVAGNKLHITITGCLFQGNTAYKGGGAIWLGKKTYYTFSNCKFISNAAAMGGALFCEASVVSMTKCLFQANKAKKVASWAMRAKGGWILKHCGGVLMLQNKWIKITKSTFKGNSATYGGCIFQSGGKLVQSGNKFIGNKAKSGPKIKKA